MPGDTPPEAPKPIKKRARFSSLECAGSSDTTPTKSPQRLRGVRRSLQNVEEKYNYGSESSGSDSGEEDMLPILMSRVYRGAVESPVDYKEDETELPAALLPDVAVANNLEDAVPLNDLSHINLNLFADPSIPQNESGEPLTQVGIGPAETYQDLDTYNFVYDCEVIETPADEKKYEIELPAAHPVDAGHEASGVAAFSNLKGVVQPNDFFHFDWKPFPDPPIPPYERRKPFTQVGFGPAQPCKDPYTIMVSIWDAKIMERIVKETNKYAQQVVLIQLQENSLGPKSRICNWTDTCEDELYTYFAIILAMGIVVISKIEEYWSSDCDIFSTPGFCAHMSLPRFQLLSACLHFNDNENMRGRDLSRAEAKLYKIEPVLTHLNSKFQTMYTMSQNIALDESLMQWKGWLSLNQFIPNKVAKIGVKTYELCESQTGYLWKFQVHAQKHTTQDKRNPLDAFVPTIVLDLLRGLEGKGYTVWMDNFYNSPVLARQLKILGFDVAGTLRTNRQFVPKELAHLTASNMRKGQITGLTSGDVDILVWRDGNRVATISTYHGNQTSVCDDIVKPNVVLEYNLMMGGVDKKDQLLAMYPIERKRTKVWYKKFFRRLLNVSVLNSYIIAKKSGSSLQHRNFRKELIQSLLSRHSKPKKMRLPAKKEETFLAKTHYLLEYPIGVNKSRLRRRCCVCKALTHFYCAACEKTVCISTCFISLHS